MNFNGTTDSDDSIELCFRTCLEQKRNICHERLPGKFGFLGRCQPASTNNRVEDIFQRSLLMKVAIDELSKKRPVGSSGGIGIRVNALQDLFSYSGIFFKQFAHASIGIERDGTDALNQEVPKGGFS